MFTINIERLKGDSMTIDKDKITKSEKRKLNQIVKLVPDNKKAIASNIADELAFMTATLAELKENVKENGTIEHFQQGKQDFFRESPALKSYNTTIKQYSALYKQLCDLLPKDTQPIENDPLMDFINGDM